MQNEPIQLPIEATLSVSASSSTPKWQNQLIRILQIVGMAIAFVGSSDFLQLLNLFPADTSKWLMIAGPTFAASIKPLILFIGDWADNGKNDGSFKISALALLLSGSCLFFAGCAGYSAAFVTPYGDVTSSKDGSVTITPRIPKSVRIPIIPQK